MQDLGAVAFRIQANLDSVVYAERRLQQLREKLSSPVEITFDANYASVQEAWDRIAGLQQQIAEMDLTMRMHLDAADVSQAVAVMDGMRVRAEENPIVVPVRYQAEGAAGGSGLAIIDQEAAAAGVSGTAASEADGGGMFASLKSGAAGILMRYWMISFATRSAGQALNSIAGMKENWNNTTVGGGLAEEKAAAAFPVSGIVADALFNNFETFTGHKTTAQSTAYAIARDKFMATYLTKFLGQRASVEQMRSKLLGAFGDNPEAMAAELRSLHDKRDEGQRLLKQQHLALLAQGNLETGMVNTQYRTSLEALNSSIDAQEKMIREKSEMQREALAENISAVNAAAAAYHSGSVAGLRLNQAQRKLAEAEEHERQYMEMTGDKTGGKFALGTAQAQAQVEQIKYGVRQQLESMHFAAMQSRAGDNGNPIAARQAELHVWEMQQTAKLKQMFAGADLAKAMGYLSTEEHARQDSINRAKHNKEHAQHLAATTLLEKLSHAATVANIAATDPAEAQNVAAKYRRDEEISAIRHNKNLSASQKKEAEGYYNQIYADQKKAHASRMAGEFATEGDPLSMLGRTLPKASDKHAKTQAEILAAAKEHTALMKEIYAYIRAGGNPGIAVGN